jgi:hypothetical protein
VKNGGHEGHQIRHATSGGKDGGNLDRMVDVWRRIDILASLCAMLVSRELQRR